MYIKSLLHTCLRNILLRVAPTRLLAREVDKVIKADCI